MKFTRKTFFDGFRAQIDDTISQEQVDGLNFLLKGFETDPHWKDLRHIAYALATAYHETAGSFQPVEEGYYLGSKARVKAFQKSLRYYPYFGRGFVQLTWETKRIPNYSKASKALGIDFVAKPDLVMVPENAFQILTLGMFEGWFTGKKLSDYINDVQKDYKNARKIINGLDKAGLIAGYAKTFEEILRTSARAANSAATAHNPSEIKMGETSDDNPTVSASKAADLHKDATEATVTREQGGTKVELSQKNELDVSVPAAIVEPEPYNKIGFFATIKRDLAAVGIGNFGFEGLSTYVQQASGWPEWAVAIVTKAALIVLIVSVGYLLFRLVHFAFDSWKKNQRVTHEIAAKTDIHRKDVVWVKADGSTPVDRVISEEVQAEKEPASFQEVSQ